MLSGNVLRMPFSRPFEMTTNRLIVVALAIGCACLASSAIQTRLGFQSKTSIELFEENFKSRLSAVESKNAELDAQKDAYKAQVAALQIQTSTLKTALQMSQDQMHRMDDIIAKSKAFNNYVLGMVDRKVK
jgi:hypothetical protein